MLLCNQTDNNTFQKKSCTFAILKFQCVKKIYFFFCCLPLFAAAQPAHYYDNAFGSTGENLRAALSVIIRPHTELTYTPGLWNAYYTTDVKQNGKLWDIYSDKPGGTPQYEYTFGTQQCGQPGAGNGSNNENSCYNREHLWPQSKFGKRAPMVSDLWIAYPTDYYVNGQRGDLPYGKVSSATKTFSNGTKIGSNTYLNAPSGTCFEPIDSFKGDIARSYFYITTCYRADSALFTTTSTPSSDHWEMATKSTLAPWAIQMLLEWHHNDPVSKKEIDRNNAAYTLQGNRNPFIDYPQFADCIWAGNCAGLSVASVASINTRIHAYPNPATNQVQINWAELAPDEVLAVDVVNLQGQLIYHAPSNLAKEVTIPVSEWTKGMYMLQVRTQHGTQAQKLIVQ